MLDLEGLLAAAQDAGVAGFEAERGALDGHVGARFVNDGDDADGHADFADVEAVRARDVLEFLADGVGQRGDLADAFREGAQARGREGEAVEHGRGQAGRRGGGNIARVGGEERGRAFIEQRRQARERGVFARRRRVASASEAARAWRPRVSMRAAKDMEKR